MDILIKGMEMPKDCRYCPCVRFDKEYGIVSCRAVYDNHNDEDVVARDYDEWDMLDTTRSKPLVKPSWCPLIPVPEHGDLGDLSELSMTLYSELEAHAPKSLGEVMTIIKKVFDEAEVILERTT